MMAPVTVRQSLLQKIVLYSSKPKLYVIHTVIYELLLLLYIYKYIYHCETIYLRMLGNIKYSIQ
jgi:hypothetical protein